MARKPRDCEICAALPDVIFADYQNKNETLPPEAGRLVPLIGENSSAYPTIRRCPDCGQLYSYEHDKDSSGGEHGWGYDEETLRKIDKADALRLLGWMLDGYTKSRDCAGTDIGSGTRSKVRQREMVAAYEHDLEKIRAFIEEFEALPDD
jgi:hypothetical protein